MSPAHPNILSLPKLFADNTSFESFQFADEYENVVKMVPVLAQQYQYIGATLTFGDNLTLGFPNHYNRYRLKIGKDASLSTHDYDNIFQWANTRYFEINDQHNYAIDLSTRIDQLKALEKLEGIALKIQSYSYQEFRVKPFLEGLPTLTYAYLLTYDLDTEQVGEFMRLQQVPDNFSQQFFEYFKVIFYKKIH